MPPIGNGPPPRLAVQFVATEAVAVATKPRSTSVVAAPAIKVNPLARRMILLQSILLLATAPLYPLLGLHIAWSTVVRSVLPAILLFGLWLYYRKYPGRPHERLLAEAVLVVLLMVVLTNIASPAQYVAVALKRPLIDPWLARADRFMGIDVAQLAGWTRVHPSVAQVLKMCYFTLLPQFLLPVVVLSMALRNRERLWEYAFHFHLCLVVTLATLMLFPAECAFTYYGFQSTINQTRFIHHFQALRDGTFTLIRFDDLEGLISMPSFHVAGALMVTWVFRGYPIFFVPLALLNSALIAATVMSGAHYFIDILATFVVFGGSIYAHRRWGRNLVGSIAG